MKRIKKFGVLKDDKGKHNKGDVLKNISEKLRNKLNMLPMNTGIYKMMDSRGNYLENYLKTIFS